MRYIVQESCYRSIERQVKGRGNEGNTLQPVRVRVRVKMKLTLLEALVY